MLVKTTIAAVFLLMLGCGAGFAQVGATASPLGITSPLGMGAGSAVPPVGIPLGATELATPGLSPLPTNSTACSIVGGASSLFDGGGNTGSGNTSSASDPCAPTATTTSRLGASASSPDATGQPRSVGRVGVPLGATELSPGGLSPPPLLLPPTMPTSSPNPMPGSLTRPASSSSSGSNSSTSLSSSSSSLTAGPTSPSASSSLGSSASTTPSSSASSRSAGTTKSGPSTTGSSQSSRH